MLFHSTRGGDNQKTFEQVLMQGLANDGGLFMPDFWPKVNIDDLRKIYPVMLSAAKNLKKALFKD